MNQFNANYEFFDSSVDKKGKLLWAKPGEVESVIFIGRHVIAFAYNFFITFYHVIKKNEQIYIANCPEKGEGVQRLCGSRSLDIFAFADRSVKPKIFVLKYPTFEVLYTFEDENEDSYISLALNDTENLVSLTGTPHFFMTIWSWRACKKLAFKSTGVQSDVQEVRFSPLNQFLLVQLAEKQGSNILVLWEVYIIKKECILIKRDIKCDHNILISSYCFSPEGNLHLVDKSGSIYFMSKDTYVVEPLIKHSHCPDGVDNKEIKFTIRWFKGGILKTTKHPHLQHYKRLKSFDWTESWKIKTHSPVKFLITTYMRDYAIAWTTMGELWKINTKTDSILLIHLGRRFEFAKFLNPIGDVVAATSKNELSVWTTELGGFTGLVNVPERITSLESHPYKRLASVGLVNGLIMMVMIDSRNFSPTIISTIFLCGEEISDIRFFNDGANFAAASFQSGKIFLLKGIYGDNTQVLGYIDTGKQIIAMRVCYIDEDQLNVIVLNQTDPKNPYAGNELISYKAPMIMIGYVRFKNNVVDFEPGGPNEFYVVVQASLLLYVLLCDFTQDKLLRIDDMLSGHEVRKFNILSNSYNYYTFGWDGMVVIRSLNTKFAICRLEVLNYLDHGVKYACLSSNCQYVLAIGSNGAMACYNTEISEEGNTGYKEKKRKLSEFDDMPLSDSFVSLEYPPNGSKENYWLKMEEDFKKLMEQKKYEKEIKLIKDRFKLFQIEFVNLLNENLALPEDEQIDLNEFDLNIQYKEKRLRDAEIERDKIRDDFEKTIKQCDDMSSTIIEACWKKMEKKTTVIKGIGGHFEVESYGLLPEDQNMKETLKWKTLRMNVLNNFGESLNIDSFYPWVPKELPVDENDENIKKIVKLPEPLRSPEEEEQLALLRKFEYSGSCSYKYVELPKELETQITFISAFQSVIHSILFQKVQFDLQEYFNKKFDEMFKRKEFEMFSVLQRNNRMRVILYEMEHSCKCPSNEVIASDPEWTFKEIPKNFIHVQDYEVKALPYISPSEQDLINDRLAEEERLRELLAADNFRELALIEMMDGVLEVRWEDELKKEVEKPICMLEKEPETYNEQDLIAIRDYEEKVKERIAERERYYQMLDKEFKRIRAVHTESISNFDNGLYKLLLLKLNVESAINQEMLKMLRMRRFNYKLFRIDLEEKEILLKSKLRESEVDYLNEIFEKVKATHRECKANYDTLVAKDNRMERQLKNELNKANAMPAQIDNLLKVYKRRPKLNQQTPPYRSLFEDLSHLVTSLSGRLHILKEYHVPAEYHEFFQTLDNMDLHSAAGPTIDENLWQKLVSARRKKIESEFKVKAAQCALTDAERTLNKFTKDITAEMQAYDREGAIDKIHHLRKEKAELQHNFQLQLILKQGQVEQSVTGQVTDFDSCILINRYVIDTINELIKEAGKRKIEAMYACADFHRGIILKEWEHKRLRMEIEDVEKQLYLIETTKITNDIKQYLRRIEIQGEPTMKELLAVEKESNEVKLIQHYHKKAMKEMTDQLKHLEAKFEETKRENKLIDKKVENCNVEVSAIHHYRSAAFEKAERADDQHRMDLIVARSKLVKEIQKTRCDILQLQTELELIRLKTYPTLKYKSLI